jgi:hypothetical protein
VYEITEAVSNDIADIAFQIEHRTLPGLGQFQSVRNPMMRKKFILTAVVAILVGSISACAGEEKEVTITGDGVCAKCTLKEAKSCQNVLLVNEPGRVVKYYLAKNRLANQYHQESGICEASKEAPVKTTAQGQLKEENGKRVLVATKIQAAK